MDASIPLRTASDGERFASLALSCLTREYPNHVVHLLNSDADARPPRSLHPAFYGSFDWHSAVHTHWMLVRLLRCVSNLASHESARAALAAHLTLANVQVEADYVAQRPGFERPYGLAWLLQLCAELHEWGDDQGRAWLDALRPLEELAVRHLSAWLPKLTHPIRSGEHSQTAFAMGLCLDWAAARGDDSFAELLRRRTLDFHAADRNAPIDYEPSGHDFLSPALAEADLMRRVLPPDEFARWLSDFLPGLGDATAIRWLRPVVSPDAADGKLAHLDGLNLSRAWMLDGIAAALPPTDPRRADLQEALQEHATLGLSSVTGEHYAGAHWLASFAVYLATRRGVPGWCSSETWRRGGERGPPFEPK